MPPPLVNYDGSLLRKEGGLAKDQECCCGSACCICGFGGSYDCVLTLESRELISQTLTDLGYASVSVTINEQSPTDWLGVCCEYDLNDCQTITAFCDEDFGVVGQVELTFCRCLNSDQNCVEVQTAQACLDIGGIYHEGEKCASGPCNPLP